MDAEPKTTSRPDDDPPLAFDEAVVRELREAFHRIFLRHPEVATLAAVVSWRGNLNDAKIQHGLWLCPAGPVQTLDGVFGSAAQTLKMLDFQMGMAYQAQEAMRKRAAALAEEVVKHDEQRQRQQEA